jgi:hypothetical protein
VLEGSSTSSGDGMRLQIGARDLPGLLDSSRLRAILPLRLALVLDEHLL